MEVEAGREIDGERNRIGECFDGARRYNLAEDGIDRKLHAGGACERRRPHSSRTDDGVRFDRPQIADDTLYFPTLRCDCGGGAAGHDLRAVSPGSSRVPLRNGFGVGVPVQRAERRPEHALQSGQRREPPGFRDVDQPTWDTELVLQDDAPRESLDVLGAVEEEEIPDLAEVDLPAGALGEACEGLDCAEPDGDVQGIRELRPHSACRPARRSGGERIAFEQANACSRLREVEGDARPDGAAADDDDLRVAGNRHRRTRFRRKNRTFAGRSASRRMR